MNYLGQGDDRRWPGPITRTTQNEIAELAEHAPSRSSRRWPVSSGTHTNDGLTPTLLSAIGTIWRTGPTTLGDLAARERVSPPMIAKVVASLEAQGLVERTSDPSRSTSEPGGADTGGGGVAPGGQGPPQPVAGPAAGDVEPPRHQLLAEALPVIERMLAPER